MIRTLFQICLFADNTLHSPWAARSISTMARKKASKKRQPLATTAVVPHQAVDLHSLMERAKTGESAAVRSYLAAGGSPTVLVKFAAASGILAISLLHAVICHSGHPHTELAECVEMLVSAGAAVDAKARQVDGSSRSALITATEYP
jgi:hypothetical protein